MRHKIPILILSLLALGAILRIHSVSPYNFYPDSYQALMVAENISTYGSVVGRLGPEGMIYPDFFGWTRPGYSLLIVLSNTLLDNIELAGHIVSLVTGIAGILLAYLYISAALRSRLTGFLGALLLALSLNHSVWSGFILSDTTGVAVLMLLGWLVFRKIDIERPLANPHDLLTGAVLALAILTRYEYVVLIIPIVFILLRESPRPLMRPLTMVASLALVLSLAYFTLSPFHVSAGESARQIGSLVGSLGHLDLTGLIGFVRSDTIIAVFFLLGSLSMASQKKYRNTLTFSLMSIFLLGIIYYQINPEMQRYYVHLLPFILLPASHALSRVVEHFRRSFTPLRQVGLTVLGLLFIAQGYLAYTGLHTQDNGLWFTPSYETVVAEKVANVIPSDALLLVSMPEPYRLVTRHSIYSVSDVPPYLYFPNTLGDREVVVVQDEGMRQIFPHFSSLLDTHLRPKRYGVEYTDTVFRYGDTVSDARDEVVLYKVTTLELERLINISNEINYSDPML